MLERSSVLGWILVTYILLFIGLLFHMYLDFCNGLVICFEYLFFFWQFNTNSFSKASFTLMQLCWREKASEADGLVNPEVILVQLLCVLHHSVYNFVLLEKLVSSFFLLLMVQDFNFMVYHYVTETYIF